MSSPGDAHDSAGDADAFDGSVDVSGPRAPAGDRVEDSGGSKDAASAAAAPSQGTKRNAFTELMSPRPKAASSSPAAAANPNPTLRAFYARVSPPQQGASSSSSSSSPSFAGRDGLGAYTADPASFPRGRVVIHHDDRFVAIHDMYPKSAVHALLLPRPGAAASPGTLRLHPFDALDGVRDPGLLAGVQAEAARLRRLVAKELQRRYGRFSAQDVAREAVLNGEGDGDEAAAATALPAGRDWEAEVRVGVHAHPSMNDLHVHVLSRDMSAPTMRHRRHYNSFNTPFLVDVADLPLAPDDPRRRPGRGGGAEGAGEAYLDRDLVCWRCGQNFGNRFKRLKEHLAVEFEEWKRE